MTALGWVCVAFAVAFWVTAGSTIKERPAVTVAAFVVSLGALGLAYLCLRAVACG